MCLRANGGLALGDDTAGGLGLRVESERLRLLAAGVLVPVELAGEEAGEAAPERLRMAALLAGPATQRSAGRRVCERPRYCVRPNTELTPDARSSAK